MFQLQILTASPVIMADIVRRHQLNYFSSLATKNRICQAAAVGSNYHLSVVKMRNLLSQRHRLRQNRNKAKLLQNLNHIFLVQNSSVSRFAAADINAFWITRTRYNSLEKLAPQKIHRPPRRPAQISRKRRHN